MKRAMHVVFIMFCVVIGTFLLTRAYFVIRGPDDSWKQRTAPLPSETVTLLCKQLDLRTDTLCGGAKVIYGPDFYNAIRDTFRPYEEYEIPSSEAASYADVEQKLGKFRYKCDEVVHQSSAPAYFSCYYDLRGDRAFRIQIMFIYPQERVWRINTYLGQDGE